MNTLNHSEHESVNNTPDMVQREEMIAKKYLEEVAVLRELMRELRDDAVSVRDIWHHLWNVLSCVCGYEEYGIKGIEEWDHFVSVFSRCNKVLLDMSLEDRRQHCKELTALSSAYLTWPNKDENDFYGARQLYEKIFDLASEPKDSDIAQKTLTFMSQLDKNPMQ